MRALPPRLYGLIKLHKQNEPIRPVISFIGTPLYTVAKFVNVFFKENIPFESKYQIKNSKDLINKLKNTRLPNDVTALYSNIPLEICEEITHDHIQRSPIPQLQKRGIEMFFTFTLL